MFDVPIHLLWTVHENLLSVSVHWCRAPTERVFIHYMYTHGRRTGGEITGNYRGKSVCSEVDFCALLANN